MLSCFGILAAFRSAVWCNFRHLKVPPSFFFLREGGRRKSRGLHITPFSFQPLSRRCAQQPEALFFGVFLMCAGALLYPSEEPRRVVLTRLHTFTSKREKRAKKVKKKAACGCPRGEGRLAGQRPTSQTPAPLPNLLFCSSLGWLMNAGPLQQQSERTRPALNLVFLPFHGRQLGLARRPSPIVLQSE